MNVMSEINMSFQNGSHSTHPVLFLTSPMKTCSKVEVVFLWTFLPFGYNVNQMFFTMPLNMLYWWFARAAEWKEFSGEFSGWFPQPHTLWASVYIALGSF